MRITTLATQNISRWVSGEIRFTPKEKELLTQRARASLAESRPRCQESQPEAS